jgi:hypothetical protein
MLHFYKFADTVADLAPARDTYQKRAAGRGWPEECPPLRAANAYGWDVVTTFAMELKRRRDGSWKLESDHVVTSDWVWTPAGLAAADGPHDESDDAPAPLTQVNAWFWDKDQTLPHVISKNVYERLRHQLKVSTFLYLATDPNELLLLTDVPNQWRPFRALSALLDTDWYPASYPWHCVLELDAREKTIAIPAGTPICRLMTVPRAHFFAREMPPAAFEAFFDRGQRWMARYGKGKAGAMMDITGSYGRQQRRSKFDVIM